MISADNCEELDKAALDPKTKPYAKREVIQLINPSDN